MRHFNQNQLNPLKIFATLVLELTEVSVGGGLQKSSTLADRARFRFQQTSEKRLFISHILLRIYR